MFPDLSCEAARTQLEPFHEKFINAIREGVRKYNELPPMAVYVLGKRSRSKATAIWAFIMHEVETTFAELEGLRLDEKFGSIEVHVGANLVARIKRMRPNGFTSNYPTARVTDFHTEAQGELFSRLWAKPMRVDVGYIEDETGTQVATVMVARRSSPSTLAWKYEMTASTPVIAITPDVGPDESQVARVVGRLDTAEQTQELEGTNE